MNRHRRLYGSMSSRPVGPVLSAARAEAEFARHGYVGLEHLLVVLAQTGSTADLLAHYGISADRARDAVWLVVGSGGGDGPRFDSATLLATLGIDLDAIRRSVDLQFGPDAVSRLYASEAGRNLPRSGPLCDLGLSPQLKRAVDTALGGCWEIAPLHLHERLLLGALDSDSPAVAAVLGRLGASVPGLRDAVTARLRIAS